MQHADIHLPYFKQGDDLHRHLTQRPSIGEALEAHAQQLECAATLLRGIKEVIVGYDVTIDADTHMIQVSGSDEIIEVLIQANYASRQDDEAEYEEYEEDEVEYEEGDDAGRAI